MKVRTDYVTNSSSSSFILAFDTPKDYIDFNEICVDYGYEKLQEIVNKSIETYSQSDHKETALELLRRYYKFEIYDNRITSEKFGENNPDWKELSDFRKSEEYEEKLQQYLNSDENYKLDLMRIKNADGIVSTEIWDTNGGLLEWAIRNGFLKSEFRRYLVVQWDIG